METKPSAAGTVSTCELLLLQSRPRRMATAGVVPYVRTSRRGGEDFPEIYGTIGLIFIAHPLST
ncbi:MAG: hypothetical protein MI919_21275 [Holophagales bacterium]|nr:hypothetical protein [Holophagales bacterium]